MLECSDDGVDSLASTVIDEFVARYPRLPHGYSHNQGFHSVHQQRLRGGRWMQAFHCYVEGDQASTGDSAAGAGAHTVMLRCFREHRHVPQSYHQRRAQLATAPQNTTASSSSRAQGGLSVLHVTLIAAGASIAVVAVIALLVWAFVFKYDRRDHHDSADVVEYVKREFATAWKQHPGTARLQPSSSSSAGGNRSQFTAAAYATVNTLNNPSPQWSQHSGHSQTGSSAPASVANALSATSSFQFQQSQCDGGVVLKPASASASALTSSAPSRTSLTSSGTGTSSGVTGKRQSQQHRRNAAVTVTRTRRRRQFLKHKQQSIVSHHRSGAGAASGPASHRRNGSISASSSGATPLSPPQAVSCAQAPNVRPAAAVLAAGSLSPPHYRSKQPTPLHIDPSNFDGFQKQRMRLKKTARMPRKLHGDAAKPAIRFLQTAQVFVERPECVVMPATNDPDHMMHAAAQVKPHSEDSHSSGGSRSSTGSSEVVTSGSLPVIRQAQHLAWNDVPIDDTMPVPLLLGRPRRRGQSSTSSSTAERNRARATANVLASLSGYTDNQILRGYGNSNVPTFF